MVAFGMRLLHAELPHHLGRSTESLDRLYYILAVTEKVSFKVIKVIWANMAENLMSCMFS